ncbi:cAMP-regulated phosphoprotein 21 isoform X3 [Scleropages formosus]|uniref:cAMP-regulated phosphoprotein 21 isoform X3 n=1 Tax=Scleropages formosus TaxID=113540 RepID=UPI0010FAC3B1|nr:cAMP-regulated phosphoprotein 21 isoform X3 [Scleropages formosus]
MSEVDTASLEGSPEVPAEPRSAREVGDTASLPSWPCPSPSPVLCAPPSCTLEQSDTRAEQQSKGKLVRSLAVCDESSLPLPVDGAEDNQGSIPLQITALPCFPEDSKPSRDELDADKNKETEKCNEKPKIRMLSKDHSQEYTDSTGIDLHDFLVNTLQKNTRDRMMLLKLEQEMIDFIADNNNPFKKFPQMSSYHRMLVHRVAAYFGMDHNVDQTGKSVIINKTSNTRIPDRRFGEHVKDEKCEESQKRFILKRDNSSTDKDENLQHRIHPFREDRRSKSMEEREEEYLRVRERIFAQDSLCSQENVYIETRILEDCSLCNDTQKKRQLFRANRDGSSRASGSRQSSTETDSRWSEPRPWSSTDSDSSSRNYRPAVTKTASIGGITVLTRGDSGASSRGSGKLCKTGSESSSSGGSSGSLSRVHLSLQGPTLVPTAPPTSCGSVSFPESQGPPSSPSYILVSLDGAGIPPGSILLNPHTGQPFVNPDGSPAIYNPPNGQQSARGQQQSAQQSQQPQQQAPPQPLQPQQPMASHMVPQALQPSSQAVPYSAISYPSQHLLPVAPNQPFAMRDDLPAQFGQLSLSRQPSGEASESSSAASVFPPGLLQQPPQQPGFVMASPSQQLPPGGFASSGPGSVLSQPALQSSAGFGQQAPSQVPMYYYSSGHYPTSTSTQYRTTPVQYSTHRNQQIPQNGPQQTGYQPLLSNQQQGFQGIMGLQQPPQNQNLMPTNQQGSQVQGMMVPYPPMSSYQVPMTQGSQGMPPPSYQQPMLLPGQSSQGGLSSPGVPVYCNMMPPSPPGSLCLLGAPCPSSTLPVMQASCRTTCANVSSSGWQVKY